MFISFFFDFIFRSAPGILGQLISCLHVIFNVEIRKTELRKLIPLSVAFDSKADQLLLSKSNSGAENRQHRFHMFVTLVPCYDLPINF